MEENTHDTTVRKYETLNGTFYCSPAVDKKMVNNFIKHNGHSLEEIEMLQSFVDRDSIVIDVGAHIGTFSIPLSRVAKQVYSFEPNPTNIELFKRNVLENNRDNIELITEAASTHVREVGFVQQPVSGQSYVDEQGTGFRTTTIDSLAVKPALIKLDIEGYELRALEGATKTLEGKPVLFFEFALWCIKRAGITIGEMDSFLKSRGYTQYLHLEDRRFVRLAHLHLVIGKNKPCNILSLSTERSLPEGFTVISYPAYFLETLKKYLKRCFH